MKVKIVKCSSTTCWYTSCIDAAFDVINHDRDYFSISYHEFDKIKHMFPRLVALYIKKSDCEIVEQ